MIRLSLYTNESVLAKGLELELRHIGEFQLLPPCSTVAVFMEQMAQHKPDVGLLDLSPEVTFALLSEVKLMSNSKIVLWVNAISPDLAFQAMSLGVRGILRKTLSPELHVRCLLNVQAGGLWFERALVENVVSGRRPELTPREGQILRLLCQGLKNKEIAEQMNIMEGSVKVHLARLSQKLGVKGRFELALFGLKHLSIGQSPSAAAPETGACGRSVVYERSASPVDFAPCPTSSAGGLAG